ncbi:hypothetical protein POTOM_005592 [Populus tomentosa]|uniref:Pentatricopeptide repeat-containing protein n=1 Tax=Populus tomentosa TaxID=118781 RepID=A0A8X8AM54_POPTO|nr:hypothetical protein POTOM_005592 [Populus tomentosa]
MRLSKRNNGNQLLRQHEEASLLYEVTQSDGLKPTNDVYAVLVSAYGQSGQLDKAFSAVAEMKPISKCKPGCDDIETMEEYLSKTKHLRIKTNTITYCSLVSVYCKTGHIMKVDLILRQVENSDIILDTPLFNCVIRAYGWAGDVDKMSNLFLEMKGRKCKPDSMIEAAQGMENMMIATRRN